jgi:cell wall-associated NlpC family hydrolase
MRFLEPVEKNFPERKKQLSSAEILLKSLNQLLGTSYVWGGNWHLGIPEMKIYYPPRSEFEKLDQALQQNWLIKGVDCSGLLYEVTDGFTPRNTAWMVDYGQAVPIQGKTQAEIISRLEPLDLIVWKGHVMIVSESRHVIESRCGKGVIKTPLNDALSEILSTRMPVDEWESTEHLGKRFVIRRWHSESLLH